MPWGGYWGGFWGGGASPGLSFALAGARAVGARAVRVAFTQQPLYVSGIGRYDASNLRRWTLTRLDTGRQVPLLGTRLVTDEPLLIELILAEPFAASHLIEYEVEGSEILSATGLMLVDPTAVQFQGMPAIREVIDRPRPLVDIRNPQTSPDRLNGALSNGSSGDYEHESGEALLKKLVRRRILVALQEIYHLADTDYGAGLQAKRTFRLADLIVMRTQLEAQILREPEFSSVEVLLTLQRSGRLDVQTKLGIRATNQQMTLQFPINPGGGSQVG